MQGADPLLVTSFSPGIWLLLGGIAATCALACLRTLAYTVRNETFVHKLNARAARLRIDHIKALRALQEGEEVEVYGEDDIEFVDPDEPHEGAKAAA